MFAEQLSNRDEESTQVGREIDRFRVRRGQDACKVRDVQYEWAQHDGYVVAAPSAATDRWIYHALQLVESVAPGCKITAADGDPDVSLDPSGHILHVQIRQPDGPLIVNLHPECADVRLEPSDAGRYDGASFTALWRVCRVLAHGAECAVFPQYDDDPADMTMSEAQARAELGWA